jgi:hypothetical protein
MMHNLLFFWRVEGLKNAKKDKTTKKQKTKNVFFGPIAFLCVEKDYNPIFPLFRANLVILSCDCLSCLCLTLVLSVCSCLCLLGWALKLYVWLRQKRRLYSNETLGNHKRQHETEAKKKTEGKTELKDSPR